MTQQRPESREREAFPGQAGIRKGLDAREEELRTRQREIMLNLPRPTPSAAKDPSLDVQRPEERREDTGISMIDKLKISGAAVLDIATRGIPVPFTDLRVPILFAPVSSFAASQFRDEPFFTPTVKLPKDIQKTLANQVNSRNELRDIGIESDRIFWRRTILDVIPLHVASGDLNKVEEIISFYVDDSFSEIVRPEDIRFAASVLRRALLLRDRPASTPLTQAQMSSIVTKVSRGSSPSTVGVLMGSSVNMLKIMREMVEPSLPEGFSTPAELRQAIDDAGFEGEEATEVVRQMTSQADAIVSNMFDVLSQRAILQSEIARIELDEIEALIGRGLGEVILDSPLAALMLPVNLYSEKLTKPLAGAFVKFVSPGIRIPRAQPEFVAPGVTPAGRRALELGVQEFKQPRLIQLTSDKEQAEFNRIYDEARRDGQNAWQSLGYAFENYNTNGFKKFLIETAVDPLSYVGFGFTKPLRVLPGGKFIYGAEKAYMTFVDNQFLKAQAWMFKVAPKTVAQVVKQESMHIMNRTVATIQNAYKFETRRIASHINAIPLDFVKDTMRQAVDLAKQFPVEGGPLLDMGRVLRRRAPLQRSDLNELMRRLKRPAVSVEDFDKGFMLSKINKPVENMMGLDGKVWASDEVADLVMDAFNILDGPDGSNKFLIGRWLDDLVKAVDDKAESMIADADSTMNLINSMRSHNSDIASKITRFDMFDENARIVSLGGAVTQIESWLKLIGAESLDRWSRGFARIYLMFAFYGPMNIAENAMKTVFMGLNPIFEGDQVRALQFVASGLTDLPEMFTRPGSFLLEMGDTPLAATLNAGEARLAGLSNNAFKRRTKTRGRAFNRYYGKLQDFLVNNSGQVGQQQAANFVLRASSRALEENNPAVAAGAKRITSQFRATIREKMDGELSDTIVDGVYNWAMIDPNALESFSVAFTPAKVHNAKVAELISAYKELGPVVWGNLEVLMQRDELFPNLTRIMTQDMPEVLRMEAMNSPELMRNRLNEFVDEMILNPPQTFEGLRLRIQASLFIGSDVSQVISMQTKQTQAYARRQLNLDFKGAIYEDMWDEKLIPFLRDSHDRISELVTQLRRSVDDVAGTSLTVEQKIQYNRVLDESFERAALMRNAWEEHRRIVDVKITERKGIEARIQASNQKVSGHPDIEKWWNDFYTARETHWNQTRVILAEADGKLLQSASDIDDPIAGGIAAILDRPLTPTDIAGLFRSIPQDLTRAIYIPEMGVLTDKLSWVERIRAKAASLAGRDADDLGFSAQRIGDVYDNIVADMLGREDVIDDLAPRLLQLDSLRSDLLNYGMRKNAIFPEGSQEAITKYAKQVEDALRADPDTAIMFADEPEVFNFPPQVRNIQTVSRVFGDEAKAAVKNVKGITEADLEILIQDKIGFEGEFEKVQTGIFDKAFRDVAADLQAQGFDAIRITEQRFPLPTEPSGEVLPLRWLQLESSRLGDFEDLLAPLVELDMIAGIAAPPARFGEQLGNLRNIDQELADDFMRRMHIWMEGEGPLNDPVTATRLRDEMGRLVDSEAFRPYRDELQRILKDQLGESFVVYRGATAEAGSLRAPAGEYISVTTQTGTARGFTAESGPVDAAIIRPEDVVAVASVDESELIVRTSAFRPRQVEIAPAGVRPGVSWRRERQKALDTGVGQFKLSFPQYDNDTAINAVMRGINPFARYQAHRLQWIPRTWIRQPGTLATLDRYQDYSDKGYIALPGIPWQINPLRGTIWMGGLRRLIQRDFPDFYDQFPNLANTFDQLSRFGFYPNIYISASFALFGAKGGIQNQQFGEVLPNLFQFPLEAYVAAFPNSGSAKFLLETLLPNRFRDVMVGRAVTKQGGDGVDLYTKKVAGLPFTQDEERVWAAGQREIATFNMINMNLGMMRFRPEELVAFQKASREIIEECTGVPVSMQKDMAREGRRVSDSVPIPNECRELVRELENTANWRGSTIGLRESEIGRNLALLRLFWDEITTESDAGTADQLAWDATLLRGEINLNRWNKEIKNLRGKPSQLIETKRKDRRFLMEIDGKETTIPLTMEERQKFYSSQGFDPLQMNPEDELLAMYRQIELKDRFDVELGVLITDWSSFYAEQRVIESAVVGERNGPFMARIRKSLTPLGVIKRLDFEQYIRPYFASFDFVLGDYSNEEQLIIREVSFTDDVDRRAELMAMERPDGTNIVSAFRSELSEFRSNLRVLDPEMDARLVMWTGRRPKTDAALIRWRELRTQYGFKGAAELPELE